MSFIPERKPPVPKMRRHPGLSSTPIPKMPDKKPPAPLKTDYLKDLRVRRE
jgi:hypothetical protein